MPGQQLHDSSTRPQSVAASDPERTRQQQPALDQHPISIGTKQRTAHGACDTGPI